MRILIAGGTGLVGLGLARELARDGAQVHILTRSPHRPAPGAEGLALVGWDGRTPEGWGHLADGADAIVNLAGETIGGRNLLEVFGQRWNASKKRRILESRTRAGEAITSAIAAARRKPSVLIQMSAVGFYGPSGAERLDETAPPADDFLARVSQAWEASTQAVEALGVRRVVVRTGLVLSTSGGLFPVVMLPLRLFVGGPLGSGRQGFSWIHAEDQRRAIRFLIESQQAGGAYNLTAPEPVSNAELGKTLARAMRRPYWFPTPALMLRLVLGEKAMLVVEGQYVLPRRLLESGFEFRFPTLEAALNDLLSPLSRQARGTD
jgi:hypothetical protein